MPIKTVPFLFDNLFFKFCTEQTDGPIQIPDWSERRDGPEIIKDLTLQEGVSLAGIKKW